MRNWLKNHLPDPFEVVARGLEKLLPAVPEPQPPVAGRDEKDMTAAERDALARARDQYREARARYDLLWSEYREARQFLLAEALRQGGGEAAIDGQQSQALLSGLEGVSFLLWLSLRKQHPEFDAPEKVLRLLEGEDVAGVRRRLDRVSGADLGEEPPDPLAKMPPEFQPAA